ncbi:hypothetical protein [Chengkuizengella sediminis]|nr:hypothetical protein [Chengkuizengella sediminis]
MKKILKVLFITLVIFQLSSINSYEFTDYKPGSVACCGSGGGGG